MAKFNHMPFEDWLLSEAILSHEENRSLQEHLHTCDSCRQLSAAWREVERQLKRAPAVSPSPGFAGRWLAHLATDRQKIHRRQTLAILLFSVGGAVLLLASLGLLGVSLLRSPETVFWSWTYQMMTLLSMVGGAGEVLSVFLRTLVEVVPLTWWILFVGILSEMAVIWVVTLRLLTSPRRIML